MSWMERLFYLGVVIGIYCLGRMHGENREHIHRALRSKGLLQAMDEKRYGDIRYKLQDDMSASTFRSYTRASFGPDLWQQPLSTEKIAIEFKEIIEDREAPSSSVSSHSSSPTFKVDERPQPQTEPSTSAVESSAASSSVESAAEAKPAESVSSEVTPTETKLDSPAKEKAEETSAP